MRHQHANGRQQLWPRRAGPEGVPHMFKLLVLGSVAILLGASDLHWVIVSSEPHHRPVFENDRIRVLNVVLPVGQTTLYHRHANDLAGVTITDSPVRTEVLDSSAAGGVMVTNDAAGPDGDAWFERFASAPVIHRVSNTGHRDVHIVAVELLAAADAGPGSGPFGQIPGYTVNVQNERVRILRTFLAPGEYREHTHSTGYVVISLSRGHVDSISGSAHANIGLAPGFVYWGEAHTKHALRNVGADRIELVEVEFN